MASESSEDADGTLTNNRWRLSNMSATLRSAVDQNVVIQNVTGRLLRQFSSPSPQTVSNMTHHSEPQRSSSVVLDMDNDAASSTGRGDAHGNIHTDGESQNEETSQTATETSNINTQLSAFVLNSLVFGLILFVKLMYDHKLGILLFIAFIVTFHYADKRLQFEIYLSMIRDPSSRQKRSKVVLAGVAAYLAVNVLATYYAFHEQHLYRSLYMRLPFIEKVDFLALLWIVVLTDFILKFAAIIAKAFVALLPRYCIGFNKRGKYYMVVEESFQLYRELPPVVPWIYFLITDEHAGYWFSFLLVIVYVILKVLLVWTKLKHVIKAFQTVTTDMIFGIVPNSAELKSAGDLCSICHDSFRDPVKLSCSHIFCQDCVVVWLDREPTCPMCRAKITEKPQWRNGATGNHVQWY